MKKLFLSIIFAAQVLFGSQVQIQSGMVKAHTEVFGDSDIDPVSKTFEADLRMPAGMRSLRGVILTKVLDLRSDNASRDEHMHELFEYEQYPDIRYEIKELVAQKQGYEIRGVLTMHGVSKAVTTTAEPVEGAPRSLQGEFSVLLTDYGMEPPKLLFLSVRNRVDIAYRFVFDK